MENVSNSKNQDLKDRKSKKGMVQGGLASVVSPIKTRHAKKNLDPNNVSSIQPQSLQYVYGTLRGIQALARSLK